MKSVKTKKSLKTRSKIINETSGLFNKQGFLGTSLSDITSATGLTKGSIYGNFKDKEELAYEVFKYNIRNLTSDIQREIADYETQVQKLMTIPRYYRKHYIKIFEQGGCPIMNAAVDSDDGNPGLNKLVQKAIHESYLLLKTLIEEGQQQGEIKIQIESEKYA